MLRKQSVGSTPTNLPLAGTRRQVRVDYGRGRLVCGPGRCRRRAPSAHARRSGRRARPATRSRAPGRPLPMPLGVSLRRAANPSESGPEQRVPRSCGEPRRTNKARSKMLLNLRPRGPSWRSRRSRAQVTPTSTVVQSVSRVLSLWGQNRFGRAWARPRWPAERLEIRSAPEREEPTAPRSRRMGGLPHRAGSRAAAPTAQMLDLSRIRPEPLGPVRGGPSCS